MRERPERPLLVVVGPTASGKSTLAARLAAAVGGEVVSADSVQVYRYFDIGSGKATKAELDLAPHHLIDCVDPDRPLEASVWARWADEIILEIEKRGNVPIVCGGTFLWIRALLYGLVEAPAGDAEVRARHQQVAEERGRAALHEDLKRVDEESAERLHPNDFVRVSRALEVFELSGRKLSELQREHGFRSPRFAHHLLSIAWPKDEYEQRLAERVRKMLRAGWKDEVRELVDRGYRDTRAMDSVGYRQVLAASTAQPPPSDDQLVEEIVRVTRVFARRQRTWLRDETLVPVSPRALTDSSELQRVIEQLGLENAAGAAVPSAG